MTGVFRNRGKSSVTKSPTMSLHFITSGGLLIHFCSVTDRPHHSRIQTILWGFFRFHTYPAARFNCTFVTDGSERLEFQKSIADETWRQLGVVRLVDPCERWTILVDRNWIRYSESLKWAFIIWMTYWPLPGDHQNFKNTSNWNVMDKRFSAILTCLTPCLCSSFSEHF